MNNAIFILHAWMLNLLMQQNALDGLPSKDFSIFNVNQQVREGIP